MLASLFRSRFGPSYPQRECFFCRTTSIILPPYETSSDKDVGASTARVTNLSASGSSANISTGTPSNWYCSSCNCQNTLAPDGTPVDQYVRPMWDESWNRDRSQLLQHTRPLDRSSSSLTSSPIRGSHVPTWKADDKFQFCHTCQTNQTLQLNMLADYLPDESNPKYTFRLEQLPAYRASISARYPAVCSNCAPHVQSRILERDQYARSWSLGKWLDLKRKASSGDLSRGIHSSPTAKGKGNADQGSPIVNGSARTRTSRSDALQNGNAVLSPDEHRSVALFTLAAAFFWTTYLGAVLRPAVVESLIGQIRVSSHSGSRTRILCMFAAIIIGNSAFFKLCNRAARFDPTQRRLQRARSRNVRPEVKGLAAWQSTQKAISCVRIIVIIALSFGLGLDVWLTEYVTLNLLKSEPRHIWITRLGLSLLVFETISYITAAATIRVVMPPDLRLVSRPLNGTSRDGPGHNPQHHHDQDDLFGTLSLDDSGQGRAEREVGSHTVAGGFGFTPLPTDGQHANSAVPNGMGLRDRDGDAIMEDATAHRRMSISSVASDADDVPKSWNRWQLPPQSSSSASASARRETSAYNFQLGPQRFWEPQRPTGLEDVFGKAVRLDDAPEKENDSATDGKWSKWFGFSS
ncbi:hypothetical protein BCV70DRAFT_101956 [Testicularia cyperi]|uniref:Ima1 N-terminal domain-containing protein n=1 Tax=Testicularia cyperi TaxID=1882483 RepID=A0A317XHG7_9BASI|nr:hypothetical protein BCV70DRAFT_101956 [Testicularia cyperi]